MRGPVNRENVASLMIDAHGAMLALDNVTMGSGSRATAAFVRGGLRVYSRILDYQTTRPMAAPETSLLQTTVNLLRARLRFLGEAV